MAVGFVVKVNERDQETDAESILDGASEGP